jgi:RNA polymerase sigma-70 factor, ECF subfamily
MTVDANLADDELLRLTASGSEPAFTTLYRRRQGAVYRFALEMSGSTTIAEEVTQEVFMALLGDTNGYDAKRGPLTSYLYGIARRMVWRHLERRRSHFPIEGEREDGRTPAYLIAPEEIERNLARDEEVRSVRRAVLALPGGYREVVVLCEFHELSYAEAARVLGCAVGTIRSRLHRARALLAERLHATSSRSTGCVA